MFEQKEWRIIENLDFFRINGSNTKLLTFAWYNSILSVYFVMTISIQP